MASLLLLALSTMFMNCIRFATGKSLVTDQGSDEGENWNIADNVDLPFQPANLTFKDVRYVVTASTSKEKLELLKGIDGVVESGRMTGSLEKVKAILVRYMCCPHLTHLFH